MLEVGEVLHQFEHTRKVFSFPTPNIRSPFYQVFCLIIMNANQNESKLQHIITLCTKILSKDKTIKDSSLICDYVIVASV